MTLDQLFQECLAEHWDCQRFRLSGHFKEVQGKYRNHIKPLFGELEYLTITRAQVRDWHKSMRETPVTANRSLEILSKLYRFSMDKELNQQGFNPCQGIKHFTERKRRRYASEAEIKKLCIIFDREYKIHPVEMTFLTTLLYTGARPRSIERARWEEFSEIDDGKGILVFEGKSTEETGDLESVLIPASIVIALKKLPNRSDGLIFGIPLPGYLWRKIRKEVGCNDLWARDFRRTFASIGMSNGVEIGIIGELLNHHSVQTTKRYAKLNNKSRALSVDKIEEKLESIKK